MLQEFEPKNYICVYIHICIYTHTYIHIHIYDVDPQPKKCIYKNTYINSICIKVKNRQKETILFRVSI